ncbi:hypothetical protein HIJ39_10295 [Sulfobacillus sp. DSM 109850]|uniref:VOC domain-containing protein n=2 Tax=Sulfobacillus harzensis TaxID=2729629 RepID=A0A7Y0L3P0_9FIRM|nr:hypothetical protein [Sulfobacillus harzensis]
MMPPMIMESIVLEVPDREAAARYYHDVYGLYQFPGETEVLGRPAYWLGTLGHLGVRKEIALVQGSSERPWRLLQMTYVTSDLKQLREMVLPRLQQRNIAFENLGESFAVNDPDGNRVVLAHPSPSWPVMEARLERPFLLTKLSHVTLVSGDSAAASWFYREILDFRIAEETDGVFFWLGSSSDHHSLAIAPGRGTGVDHVAFELESWAEVKRLADHLADQNVALEAGPGRHRVGGNIFIYTHDLNGLRFEFLCEMREVVNPETAKVWPRGSRAITYNAWGIVPPENP